MGVAIFSVARFVPIGFGDTVTDSPPVVAFGAVTDDVIEAPQQRRDIHDIRGDETHVVHSGLRSEFTADGDGAF